MLYGALRCRTLPFGAARCRAVPYRTPYGSLRWRMTLCRVITVPCGARRRRTVPPSAIRCPGVSNGAVRCRRVPYGVIRCRTLPFGAARCRSMHYCPVRCSPKFATRRPTQIRHQAFVFFYIASNSHPRNHTFTHSPTIFTR